MLLAVLPNKELKPGVEIEVMSKKIATENRNHFLLKQNWKTIAEMLGVPVHEPIRIVDAENLKQVAYNV